MARNEPPDSEFDQDMERILREHFESEAPDLQSSRDPWPWLEARMEEPDPRPFFPRILGGLNPVRDGRLSPAFAVAGVAVVAVVVTAVVWAASGNGGAETPDGPEGLASVQPTTAPPSAATSAPMTVARSAAATTGPQAATVRSTEAPAPAAASPTQAAPSVMATPAPAAAQTSAEAAVPAAAPAAVPTPQPTPNPGTLAPTVAPAVVAQATRAPAATETAMAMAMEEPAATDGESETHLKEAEETAAAMVVVTPVPQAEAAPAHKGPRGPRGAPATAGTGGGTTPPDVTFRDYPRQPFVVASEDNVSTFSLDTDRTSFHLALNWARAGYEVHPDSVRAEEWVNAFDYGYPPPSGDRDFAITTGFLPHPLDNGKLLAQIAFQAPEVVDDTPLNVTLVLDASGSMADGNRVAIARQAAESIRQSLRSEDRIAVVHFTDHVLNRYTVEHRAPEDRRVRDSINRLAPHGGTNVQAGLDLGVRLADDAREGRPNAYNYVILMSDGVANVDATDPFAILETAYDANARNPLRLITVGVGINNYNDVLLEQLAQHGNGWYRYLNNTDQAQATFSRENWLALSTPFADQTRAQVTWDAEVVERWRIIGYENRVTPDHTFAQDRKEFAEIYSGSATTVFYELELVEGRRSGPVFPMERVELRWVDPNTGESRSWPGEGPFALAGWSPGEISFADAPPQYQLGAIVALAADGYGSLSDGASLEDYQAVQRDLSALLERLRSLHGDLGALDAYGDFLFLLDYIIGHMEERLPPPTPSGYSR